MCKDFISMDLQLFAEEVFSGEPEAVKSVGERTFSQDDVNNIVKGRVQRATRELEKQVNDLKASKDVSVLSENVEENESDGELEALRLENLNYKLTEVATKALESRGYQVDENILKVVVGSDEESTKKSVKALTGLVESLVNKRVKEKARENTPTGGSVSFGGSKKFSIGDFASEKRVAR